MKPDEFYTDLRPHQICNIEKSHKQARKRLGLSKKRSRLVVETAKSRKKQVSGKNKNWVTGNKKMMKQSARYPIEFASSLAECIISELTPSAATATRCVLPPRKRIVRRTTV